MKNIFKKISKASILGIIMAVVFVASYVFASIPLGSNFQLNSQLPLDARTVVATLAARDAMPSGQRYQGLTVYVTANSTNYQLQGGILNTNWVAIGGGSTSETDPVFTASQAFSITGTDITHLSNLSGTNTGNQVGDGVTITGAGTIADPFVSHGGSGLIGSTSAITPGVSTETWLGTSVADMGTASTNNTVFIGIGAGKKGTNANYSNFIGYKAGGDSGLTTGAINAAYSNFIGYSAGKDSANAAHSIFIGTDAGLTDTVDNTVSGTSILIGDYTSTGGNKNSIAIGANATNTASNQFLIGSSYTQFNMRGVNYTMPSLQGGAGTVLANDGSGNLSWTPGGGGLIGSTSALGTETWLGTSIADMGTASHANTVFIGINAGKNATSATHSIFIGLTAGQSATNAAYSTFIGDTAGQSATNAAYSTFIGYGAGQSTTIAANSTFIGTTAGQNATVAQNSNFIGANSGQSATNAEDSTFIGFSAGNGATNAANSIFIGDTAGEYDNINNTVSGTSILIGNNTSTDGYQNSIAIGTNAISTATNQFLIDQTYTQFNMRGVNYTMPSLQGGVSTVLTNNGSGGLSWAAAGGLLGSTSTTGTETWLGTSIADMGTASTTNTMFIGIDAGQNATTADNSIFIGNNAGASDSVDNTVSGTSILIGNSTSTGGFQNSIAIGDSAINTATNQFLIGSSYTNINMGGIQIISGNILPTVASTVSDNITFVNTTGNVNAPSSLALGSDGYARIAYSDAESLKLAQCTNNDCITSNITSITPISVAANPSLSIALSSDGYARIAYFNVTNTDLKFAQCTNDDCTTKNITTVDSAGNVGQNPSLALGSDGYARISYADTTNGNLKFAQCTNADCTTKNIATVDSGGFNSSLALGSDSFARIAYIDALGGGNIKFAQCTNGACSAKNK